MTCRPFLTVALPLILWTAPLAAAELEPTLGKKGKLLLEEKFDGDTLPKGWTGKTGGLRVADGGEDGINRAAHHAATGSGIGRSLQGLMVRAMRASSSSAAIWRS